MDDLIKREDATETFAELYDIFDDCPNIVKELHKVYDKILAIPSAEPKTGDLISREDAINVLDDGMNKWYSNVTLRTSMREAINSIPSAEKQGEWIDWLGKGNEWECSICKCSIESHGSIAYNFCPNCGARMAKE